MSAVIERRKITVPKLAKVWGVSANKIIAWIKSGELRAVNMATRESQRPRYSIDVADIERFEADRLIVPEPVAPVRRRRPAGVKDFV